MTNSDHAFQLKRNLNTVNISYYITGGGGSFTSNSWFTVSSSALPLEFRPSQTIYEPIINHSNSNFRGTLKIDPNGTISIKTLNKQTAFDCVGNISYSL